MNLPLIYDFTHFVKIAISFSNLPLKIAKNAKKLQKKHFKVFFATKLCFFVGGGGKLAFGVDQKTRKNHAKHREKNILKFFWNNFIFVGGGRGDAKTCLWGQYLKLAIFCWQVLEHIFLKSEICGWISTYSSANFKF